MIKPLATLTEKYKEQILEMANKMFPIAGEKWTWYTEPGACGTDIEYVYLPEMADVIHWFELLWWFILPTIQKKAGFNGQFVHILIDPLSSRHPIDIVYPLFKQLYK